MGIPMIATALSAVGGVATGVAAYQQGQAEKEQAEINSYIGRTRAMQTDEAARSGLNSEMATLRATLSANGQKAGVGTGEIMMDMRKIRAKERRVEFGNRMQESSQYKIAAKSAGMNAKSGLLGGFLKAAPDFADMYELSRKR